MIPLHYQVPISPGICPCAPRVLTLSNLLASGTGQDRVWLTGHSARLSPGDPWHVLSG